MLVVGYQRRFVRCSEKLRNLVKVGISGPGRKQSVSKEKKLQDVPYFGKYWKTERFVRPMKTMLSLDARPSDRLSVEYRRCCILARSDSLSFYSLSNERQLLMTRVLVLSFE